MENVKIKVVYASYNFWKTVILISTACWNKTIKFLDLLKE